MDKKAKLLALFREGATDGEKRAALLAIKRLCKKEKIPFDEFMQSKDIIERHILVKNQVEFQLLSQIMYTLYPEEKKDDSGDFSIHKTYLKRGEVLFRGTPQQYLEVKYAFYVYRRELENEKKRLKKKQIEMKKILAEKIRDEKKNLFESFLYANDIFPKTDLVDKLDESEEMKEERKRLQKVWDQSRGISRTNLKKPLNRGTYTPEKKLLLS